MGSSRLPLRAFSGASAALAAAALAAPATAPAITRTVDYGQPGPAQMRAVRGWWNPNGGRLRMPARYVSRTPMSPRTQTICAEFTLYRFTAEYFPFAAQCQMSTATSFSGSQLALSTILMRRSRRTPVLPSVMSLRTLSRSR